MDDALGMFDPLPRQGFNGERASPVPPSKKFVAPVPDDAPEPPQLRGSQRHWYVDVSGRRLFAVDRHEPLRQGDRKSFVPHSLWQEENGALSWLSKHPPVPRALYGLDRLAKRPTAPVLLVEGEKTADAAAKLFPDHVVITSSGGSHAVAATDWSPLAGRHVVIWPDHDEPGRIYAADVRRLALVAGAASVDIITIPTCWTRGWDLADYPPDGVSEEDLTRMVRSNAGTPEPTPLLRSVPPPEPYPTSGLGEDVAQVVDALHEIVQSPLALCANSVLATIT